MSLTGCQLALALVEVISNIIEIMVFLFRSERTSVSESHSILLRLLTIKEHCIKSIRDLLKTNIMNANIVANIMKQTYKKVVNRRKRANMPLIFRSRSADLNLFCISHCLRENGVLYFYILLYSIINVWRNH